MSVPSTLQQLLALMETQQIDQTKSGDAEYRQQQNVADDDEKEEMMAEEAAMPREDDAEKHEDSTAVEMAKTLCSLSQGNGPKPVGQEKLEQEANSTSTNAANGDDFQVAMMKTELNEEICSLNRPISVLVSPIRSSRTMTLLMDSKICKDANFGSFADFEQAFEQWKQCFQHPFRVASSEKHEDPELAARFRYRYVVYHCSRYGEPRKRGAGRRPHQNYLPCGCNAKLRLNYHAQNGGSLCVTTLVTEHNHGPASDEGIVFGSATKRRKSSPEDESSGEPCDHSPNSTASSTVHSGNTNGNGGTSTTTETMAGGTAFSPLSLQPVGLLHHSPSSGQSSTETGIAIGHSPSTTVASGVGGQLASIKREPSALRGAKMSKASAERHRRSPAGVKQSRQQQNQQHATPTTTFGSSGSASAVSVSDFFPSQSVAATAARPGADQLLPLIQELLRFNASGNGGQQPQQQMVAESKPGNNQQHQHQLLLGLLSPQQQQKHQQQNGGNGFSTSFLAALQQSLQGSSTTSSSSAASSASSSSTSSSNSSALPPSYAANSQLQALLQLQLLINSNKQQNHGGNSSAASSSTTSAPNNNNMQLLQLLAQQQQQRNGQQQQSLLANQQQQQQRAAQLQLLNHFGGSGAFDRLLEPTQTQASTAQSSRAEIIQEADLMLQTLVSQMIRTRDLHGYLRRLRQFLADNNCG